MPRNNGVTNTVSISLPGLFSLVFVEPEVIPHRLYSLLLEKISSSGSLRRLRKKWAFKMCMVCLNIFSISLVTENAFYICLGNWCDCREWKGSKLLRKTSVSRGSQVLEKVFGRNGNQLTKRQSQKCDKGDLSEAVPFLIFLAVGVFFKIGALSAIQVVCQGTTAAVCWVWRLSTVLIQWHSLCRHVQLFQKSARVANPLLTRCHLCACG